MVELRVRIRVRPGASRTAVGGAYDDPAGRALVVVVPARAVDDRATKVALRAVAAEFGVPYRAVTLIAGGTSRDKLLAFEPMPAGLGPADLAERLAALMGPG